MEMKDTMGKHWCGSRWTPRLRILRKKPWTRERGPWFKAWPESLIKVLLGLVSALI